MRPVSGSAHGEDVEPDLPSDPRHGTQAGEQLDVPADTDLVELERLAVDLAAGAGHLVRAGRDRARAIRTKSALTDVVTDMDAASEAYLRDRLAQERPGDGFHGEEGGEVASRTALTWVVDPIDGTVNYVYGGDEYAVSVALVVGDPRLPGAWLPVVGAVCRPETGRVFHARRGGGAWLRSVPTSAGAPAPRRLHVTDESRLGLVLLGTGFGYDEGVRREQAGALVEILPQVRDIRRAGSAALDLCAVAAGRLDAYYERGVHAWDIAAGWLVVTEAGGRVGGLASPRPDAAGTLASNRVVHDALAALVRTATGS